MSGGIAPDEIGPDDIGPDDIGPGDIGPDEIARILKLDDVERGILIRSLTMPQRRNFAWRWSIWAHEGQSEPAGDWRVWLICAGRGFGKTRAGAEWVSAFARTTPDARIALVGATAEDVRRVMIEGESGLINVARPHEPVSYRRGSGELVFASGARAAVFSAAAPDKLRGPEHHAAWCDELAKWRYGDAAWDNLQLGMRLGEQQRIVVTTTPRPNMLMTRVMGAAGTITTGGTSHANPHLPLAFLEAIEAQYGGTRLGRQEIAGELLHDVVGALWSRSMFEACRVGVAPALVRTVVAVDPPASVAGDACGIVAVALGADGRGYVLEDASVRGLSPQGWARAVVLCAARHRADRVIAEKNQGGNMVASVLFAADSALPLALVHASQGKTARAEPVAMLYEQGRVSHVGAFPDLEDELCGFVIGGGYDGPGGSPDRADALVWALGELLLKKRRAARVRAL